MLGRLSPSSQFFKCEKVAEHPLDCFLLQLHLLSKIPSKDVSCSGPRCLWKSPASSQSSRHCWAYSHPDKPPGMHWSSEAGEVICSLDWVNIILLAGSANKYQDPLVSRILSANEEPHHTLCQISMSHCLPSSPSSKLNDPLSWIITK